MKKLLFILLPVMLLSSLSMAATYYVSSWTGDDSRTKEQAQNVETPWKTITYASSQLSPNDILEIVHNNHNEESIIIEDISGLINNYISIRNYNGEEVTINSNFIRILNSLYIHITGLDINLSTGGYAIYLSDSDYCILSNCTIINDPGYQGGTILRLYNSYRNTIQDNIIDGVDFSYCGISISGSDSDDNLIQGNYITQIRIGIMVSQFGNSILNNTITDCYETTESGKGIVSYGESFIDANTICDIDGIGILIFGNNNQITRNQIYANESDGILISGSYGADYGDDNIILNNTVCYNLEHGINIEGESGKSCSRNIVKNNILNENTGYQLYVNEYGIDEVELDYNDYWYEESLNCIYYNTTVYYDLPSFRSATGHGTNSLNKDPSFVSDTIPFDFHLSDGSEVIDKGTLFELPAIGLYPARQLPYEGDYPDMGALEDIPPIILQITTLLEAQYDQSINEMLPYENIPTTSPYNEDLITVTSIPSTVTDWVLVQLRETAGGAAVISKSAFLHETGTIGDVNGPSNEVYLEPENEGNYYVVVKHRKHLEAVSSTSLSMNFGETDNYDFTTGSDKFYTAGNAIELETGVWGMRSDPDYRRDLVFKDNESSDSGTYKATNSITAGNNTYTIDSGDNIIFNAGREIRLVPGFTASSGCDFTASIDSDLTGDYPEEQQMAKPLIAGTTSRAQQQRIVSNKSEAADSEESAELEENTESLHKAEQLPTEFNLYPNFPNPFNPETTIRYALPKKAGVRLTIFNLYGQVVKTLVDQQESAGYKSVVWNATNRYGNAVSSGIYFYVLETDQGYSKSSKMVLLK